jgi:hypothetical protein
MGFGLYINSRVEVEGWDLELLFKKFARSIKTTLLICVFMALPFFTYAESTSALPDDFPVATEKAIYELKTILASPDFGGEREGWAIRFKDHDYEELPDVDLGEGFEKIRSLFGFLLRLFVVLAIIGFAVFVFCWLIKNRNQILRGKLFTQRSFRRSQSRQPEISRKSAELLFSKAEDFFNNGNLREAWAACFSGCLGAYSISCSIVFPPDATEYDCLGLVREADSDERGFDEIVQNWILFAYGSRLPTSGTFEKALAHGRSLLEGK